MNRIFASILLFIASGNLFCAEAIQPLDSVSKVDDLLAAVKKTKAKVILLNFWGITCSPCIAEMPVLSRASEKFKDNPNVAFLGVCIPEESVAKEKLAESAAEIVRKRKVAYRNWIWSGTGDALLEKFDIQGTPYTVLLSSDGKLLGEIKIPLDPDKAAELINTSIAKALETVETKK
ncbi:MAG TPA: TlpA disulfide reductase family protein [Planctomycetota bacterium]|nr:TlpA disulfide reductase family protein [Planctomycetota bacterium]